MYALFCCVAMGNLLMPPPDVAGKFFDTQSQLWNAWAKQFHTEVPRETAPAPAEEATNEVHIVPLDQINKRFARSYLHRVQ